MSRYVATHSDAVATAELAIGMAIADTCKQTGLRAGPASDALIDAIIEQVQNPATAWAFKKLLEDATPKGTDQ